MREIDCEQIILAVKNLCINANCFLPADVRRALDAARESEQSEVGRAILGDLAENYRLADAEHLPICQDTGMAVLFVELGQEVHITGGLLEDALNEGVRRGYVDGLLRLSVVADPIRRGNTNDNTPAALLLSRASDFERFLRLFCFLTAFSSALSFSHRFHRCSQIFLLLYLFPTDFTDAHRFLFFVDEKDFVRNLFCFSLV